MFAWDANTEADLAGYRLYQSTTNGQYEYGPDHCVATIPAGTETVTLERMADGTWYWVLTAFDKTGNESGPSNEVTATVDTVAPAQPKTLRIPSVISKIKVGKNEVLLSFRQKNANKSQK